MPKRSSTPSNQLSYRPSVFYFRKELRAARTLAAARAICVTVGDEIGQLSAWARSQGLEMPPVPPPQIPAKPLATVRECGLALCLVLEAMKAVVRDRGLIPPRFRATSSEAQAKWAPAGDQAAASPLREGAEPG